MTEITLKIKDDSILPELLKVIKCYTGVSIKSPHLSRYEKAKQEARNGDVETYSSAEALFDKMN